MSAQPNPSASPAIDNQFLLALLRESREIFLSSFAGVSDEQSRRRPAPDSWSVLDTVEHLAVAETTMLKLVTTQRRRRSGDAPNREQAFLQMVGERTHKMQSPEGARPTGRFANLAEAANQFKASREAIIRFIAQNTEDLRVTEVTHPHPLAGVISSCEMVMARHGERHAKQIKEIRETLKV